MARYLGIEVTEQQVKGVVLRAAYRKLQIESVERVTRAPGAEGLREAAAEVARRAGGPFDASYAAMPGSEVSMRLIELPKAVVRRGGRMIATELEGSLPYEVELATVDAQVVRAGETVEMLAAAARTDRVSEFVAALRAAGVEPRAVGVGPIAMGDLVTAAPQLGVPGPILLLHAYENHADFTILVDGVTQMARTIGGQTTQQARERGVRQTLGAYLAGGGAPPVAAYLCGEWAESNREVVTNVLGLPFDAVFDRLPLTAIEILPTVTTDPQLAPCALAMALRGLGRGTRVDLRKGDLAISRGSQALRERGPLLAACAGAIVLSWGFATAASYASISGERDRLREALGNVSQEALGQRVTDPARAIALATGGGQTEQDPLPLADAFDVIGALSARIPDAIRHDIVQLDVNDEHVSMQGMVDSLQARDEIVTALSEYPCFQNIQRGRTQRNPGDERQQYTLDIEFRCPRGEAAGARNRAAGARGATGTTGTTGSGTAAPSGTSAPAGRTGTGGASGSGI